jgi:hypothetical protein
VFAAKQKPHQPGMAPALGLCAGSDELIIASQANVSKEDKIMTSFPNALLSRSADAEPSRRRKARSVRSRPWRSLSGRLRLEVLEDRTLPAVAITGLGDLPIGQVATVSYTLGGINDQDEVVGYASWLPSGPYPRYEMDSFVWQPGSGFASVNVGGFYLIDNAGNLAGGDLRYLGNTYPGYPQNQAYLHTLESPSGFAVATAMNAAGDAVGYDEQTGDALFWPAGETAYTDLGIPGGTPTAINDSQEIVGDTQDASGNAQPFLCRPGLGPDLLPELPGYPSCYPVGIADDDWIVGYAADQQGHIGSGVLWTPNAVFPLYFVPTAMNTEDMAVGHDFEGNPVVWSPDTGLHDLNRLLPPGSGWTLDSATAINSNGDIVGYGNGPGAGNSGAYLLTGVQLTPGLALTTVPGPTVVLGSGVPLTDSAVLSAPLTGGYDPTGTITFTLVAPDGATVDTETAIVTGSNQLVSTPQGYLPSGTGALTGTYQWQATYSGDINNRGIASTLGSEPEKVLAASPTITTTTGGTVVLGSGVPLTDSATLNNGYNPTGSITFTLTAPDGTIVDTEIATVNGNGTYSTPTGYVPAAVGTYQWVASYSGDDNNLAVASASDSGLEEVITLPAPDHFLVTPSVTTTVAGTPFDVTVTVQDASNNTVTGYAGIVAFSSTEPYSIPYGTGLPVDYTFTAADGGVHTFPMGVTLYNAGSWSVTATDTATGITGSAKVRVTPASAIQFGVIAPASVAANAPFDVTVIALDPYGNVDTNYQGTITFSTTDPGPGVVLPANYPFTVADAGMHTFPRSVILITPGIQYIYVTDTNGFMGYSYPPITVTPPPRPPGGGGGGAAGMTNGVRPPLEALQSIFPSGLVWLLDDTENDEAVSGSAWRAPRLCTPAAIEQALDALLASGYEQCSAMLASWTR